MRRRSSVEPVLGTRLTLLVEADDEAEASAAEEVVLAVADRLEGILTVHRPDSDFNRWRSGALPCPPVEVVTVLAAAQEWFERTNGSFNPCLGAVMRRWRRAEQEQRLPDRDELLELSAAAKVLPFDVVGGVVTGLGDCRTVDVQGIAKGWIADEMTRAGLQVGGVRSVLVDLGGDVRHGGRGGPSPVSVAVEDPFAVADNARPLAIIRLGDGAVATSGGGRRGWSFAGDRYGHLVDPRTGWPLARRRSCTVVAATAVAADAAASALAALDEDEAGALADREGLAALRVSEHGAVWRSAAWPHAIDERSEDTNRDQGDGEE